MSLVRHANSPYWYMSFMVNGKAVFRSTKTTNKALAQKIENEARRQAIEELHFEKKDEVTLGDLIDEYLLTRQKLKSYPLDQYFGRKLLGHVMCPSTRQLTEVFGFERSMPFHTLKTKDLFRLLQARKQEGVSSSTILLELLFINGLMKTAKQLDYALPQIDIGAFKKEHRIKPNKGKLRYLTVEEEERLLNELSPGTYVRGLGKPDTMDEESYRFRQDNYDFVVMLLDTGARHTEIAEIEWTSIDMEARTINLYRSKVQNESVIPMTERLFEILKRRLAESEGSKYVFVNADGTRPRQYSPTAFKSACSRAGLSGVTFHTLRHTTASRLAQAGVSLQDISLLLGHTTVNMSQRYAHLSPSHSMNKMIGVLNR